MNETQGMPAGAQLIGSLPLWGQTRRWYIVPGDGALWSTNVEGTDIQRGQELFKEITAAMVLSGGIVITDGQKLLFHAGSYIKDLAHQGWMS